MSPSPPSRNPYIDQLLNDPNEQRARAMGDPAYGISAMMAFLKDFFLDPANSNDEFVTPPSESAPGHDDPATYLQVSSKFNYTSVNPNQKPRIVVASRGIQDRPVGISLGQVDYNFLRSRETRLYIGTHRLDVMCYATNLLKTERVSTTVYNAIRAFAPRNRQLLGWVSINAIAQGSATPIFPAGSSKPDLTMIPITVVGLQSARFSVTPTGRAGNFGIIVQDEPTGTVIDKIATGIGTA
jgi:hypothetical protein